MGGYWPLAIEIVGKAAGDELPSEAEAERRLVQCPLDNRCSHAPECSFELRTVARLPLFASHIWLTSRLDRILASGTRSTRTYWTSSGATGHRCAGKPAVKDQPDLRSVQVRADCAG